MSIECNICGEEMRKTDDDEWTCPNCRNRAFGYSEDDIYFEHDHNDYESLYDGCIDEY